MIRAYLTTFRNLHIETWIAHGTLLGWWWNTRVLPWDWDLDVQVSGQTLAYLGEFLNFTTHIYQSGAVERQYFLDVNPYHIERTRGNGDNIIDARWIDVATGLFVDITGVSEIDPTENPGKWMCKNEHEYATGELWPMRETLFEDVPALVPFEYKEILTREYEAKALTLTEYEG
jgi:phosphorylcholine metabolism protein LicD